ncbi:hypothetical protein [Streptomyces aureus]|uniref:hypothetical protein n=1 Tax=Streptomyces aureus TaxID=193461 RepID=UPI0007C5A0BC|nr:hypothetical protein [Streptomyces aureus]
MTDRLYTDEDLRDEAARQHAMSTDDPDFMGIGERMDRAFIDSTVTDREVVNGTTWGMLTPHDFNAAQRGINRLLTSAADVSAWAVNLGADGLEPSTEDDITLTAGEKPIARIHFAFDPEMPEDARAHLVEGVADAINDAGVEREDDVDEHGDSDADVFDLISEIASSLRDATDSGEYHAVGLIYDLANGRTTVAEARAELADIEFGHV